MITIAQSSTAWDQTLKDLADMKAENDLLKARVAQLESQLLNGSILFEQSKKREEKLISMLVDATATIEGVYDNDESSLSDLDMQQYVERSEWLKRNYDRKFHFIYTDKIREKLNELPY